MPKRKITLDEAFAVFEQHGLEVEVKAIAQERKTENLSDFLEGGDDNKTAIAEENKKTVKITLFAAHSIGTAGIITVENGEKQIKGNSIESYGPGIVTVPLYIAQHLLHQDLLARRGDERMLENKVRSYVVHPAHTSSGIVNIARHVSSDNGFDLSGFLGKLGENAMYRLG